MKKKLLITALIIAAMVVAWLLFQSLQKMQPPQPAVEVPVEEVAEPDSDRKPEVAVDEQPERSAEELLAANPKLQKIKTIQQSANREIRFYGKVVDQTGEPVANAEITYRYAYYPDTTLPTFSWSVRQEKTTADAHGIFQIENTEGVHLTIAEIRKSGYVVHSSQVFQYRARTIDDVAFSPDPANPVIFQAWKKGYAAKELIESSGFWGVKIDGEYHGLPIPATDKAIKIKFEQNPEGDWENPLDWAVHIQVEEGGIAPTEDVFTYEAPQSGYQSKWSWRAEKHGDRWPVDTRQNFYFQTGNGGVFGRMEVRFIPYYGEKNQGVIDVKYVLNPTGSRNLLPADE
jgi:hypothetical protein